MLPTTSHQNQKDQLRKSKMKLVGAQPSPYCSQACHLIGERDIHCSICSSLSTAQSMIDTEHVGPDRKLKMRFKSMHFWLESRSNSPGHLRVYYVMSTDTVLPVLMCSWIHAISVAICLTISCKRFYPQKNLSGLNLETAKWNPCNLTQPHVEETPGFVWNHGCLEGKLYMAVFHKAWLCWRWISTLSGLLFLWSIYTLH